MKNVTPVDRRTTTRVSKRERELTLLKRELDLMVERGELTRDAEGRYALGDIRAD